MAKLKFLALIFLTMALSVAAIYWIYPRIHPYAGIHLPLDKNEIEKQAYRISEELGLPQGGASADAPGYIADARWDRNTALVRQLQTELGLEESNRALRKGAPGYSWQIFWIDEKQDLSFSVQPKQVDESGLLPLAEQEWRMDIYGRLLEFQKNVPEDLKLPEISVEEARAIAGEFLVRYSNFYEVDEGIHQEGENSEAGSRGRQTVDVPPGDAGGGIPLAFKSARKINLPNRVDHEFRWRALSPETGDTIRVQLKIAGNQVAAFSADYKAPAIYSAQSRQPITQFFSPLLTFAIAIITIVIAFKRWRAYELSFKFAVPLGIFTGLIFGVYLYQSLPPNMGIGLWFSIIFAPLTIGGTLIFVWAVGESVGREVWNDKFTTIDLLRNGYTLHSLIGKSVLRGLALGLASFTIWLGLIELVERITPLTVITQDENMLRFTDAAFPVVLIACLHLFSAIYVVAAYYVLALSLLRKRISSPYISLPLIAIFLVLAYQSSIEPLSVGGFIETASTLLVVWAFYRFDIITGFIALFTATAVEPALALFTAGSSAYLFSGYIILAGFALLAGYALSTLYTKDRISDFQRIAPVYVKNITERQRLQRELEIAREVQMSFLPRANPQMSRLDIASRCEPALEVGGDYYDFITLDGNRLGVAIGDVSGKGTQAAFYMTLTKGFLRALANGSDSPAAVLTRLNRLFYDNVKRGVFISMVYGVFDMNAGMLTLARAGHNPVIMRKTGEQELQMLHPRGLALGMEQGNIFEHTIQEVKIHFQNRDLFVFYTDGFTEAMDKNREEFGDERFEKAIEKHAAGAAEQIMEGIFREVKQFTGRVKQHDDMTIVVVKIADLAIE